MIAKKHLIQGRLFLALCDSELKGKIFEDKTKILNLSSSYFDGEEMGEERIIALLNNAESIHAVGEECVKLLLKVKMIEEQDILKVKNAPHVQVYK